MMAFFLGAWRTGGIAKFAEIAGVLSVPVGTVRSRIHRARKIMAGRLEGYARGLGYRGSRMHRAA